MKWILSIASILLFAAVARAEVDLEWRLENDQIRVGDTVYVELYAVADNGGLDEPFCLAAVAMSWDAEILRLDGVINETPWPPDGYSIPMDGYDWMFSGFPNDSNLDGINDTFDDGNADYQAWGNPWGWWPTATPDGMWVTTFVFQAVESGESALVIEEALGSYTVTAVYDEEYGGWNIVGDLGTIELEILPGTIPVRAGGNPAQTDMTVVAAPIQ